MVLRVFAISIFRNFHIFCFLSLRDCDSSDLKVKEGAKATGTGTGKSLGAGAETFSEKKKC